MTSRTTILIACTAIAASLLAGCTDESRESEPKLHLDQSRESFSSVRALAATADLVILGRIGDVVAREMDNGGEDESDPTVGVPMVIYSIDVTRALKGEPGERINFGMVDLTKIETDGVSPIEAGQMVMMFLRHRTSSDAPGIDSVDSMYVSVSGDNGVFDARGGQIIARSAVVEGLVTPGGPMGPTDRFTTTVAEVRSSLR